MRMCTRGSKRLVIALLVAGCLVQSAAAWGAGGLPKPVDLTKPHNFQDPDEGAWIFTVGPTGLIGLYMGGPKGHQIEVRTVAEGSPADGKIEYGDVLLGVNGKPFKTNGENLIVTIGNAIDEAEREENGGRITFTVWRDENLKARHAAANIDMRKIDVNDYFKVVEADTSADLDRYKSEQQVKQSIQDNWKESYERFPIQPKVMEVQLTLEVMGTYSNTSPWDCPKVKKIRERAYPHLEKKIQSRRGFRGWSSRTVGLALLASGKPEHVAMVRDAVHRNEQWMTGFEPGDNGWGGGYKAWYAGYDLSFLGEYYLRTGDKAVFEGLAALARGTAKIQCGGGTWGHSWARRSQNFGELHGPAPGYGAMNQAGGPCFYGLTLAQKAGIEEPIVDDAIRRAARFNSTYVDKGTVPYGFHAPALYEDSNGKNGPPGLAMRIIGEKYKAKYFALSCSVASSWGYRGGHGDGTFGNYWPQLCSALAGKEAVMLWMKKMRPYYTMARQWDGTFVSVSHGGNLGIGCLFDPTAMYMLHFSIPLKQLYMTGRDPVEEIRADARDIMHLKDRMGLTPWRESTTDELIGKLDTFSAEQRRKHYVGELVKRYEAGEKDIPGKLTERLDHDDRRVREAALEALARCGPDALRPALPRILAHLDDSAEIVRMAAVRAVQSYATLPGQERRGRRTPLKVDLGEMMKPLFEASLRSYPDDTNDNVNTPYVLMKLMINTDNPFAHDPFGQGEDPAQVRRVLERFLRLDPREGVMGGPSRNWDRQTCIQMAGPLVFVAGNRSLNGIMFSGGALSGAQSLLLRHGFLEGLEASAVESLKISRQPRAIRPRLSTTGRQGTWFSPEKVMKYKGAYRSAVPWLRQVLIERPNLKQDYFVGKIRKSMYMSDAIDLIEADDDPEPLASLEPLVERSFGIQFDSLADDAAAQAKFCRDTLEPERKTIFRQMAAMKRLVELEGTAAIADLASYFLHDEWRLQDRARALVVELKADGTGERLAELAENEDPSIAAGALQLLGERGDADGLAPALKHIASHAHPEVRGAAAMALVGSGGEDALQQVLTFMKAARDVEEFEGYERALLLVREDEVKVGALCEAIRPALPNYGTSARRSLYYVLGQFGGEENLAFLQEAVRTEDEQEFYNIVEALSWSPDVAATKKLLAILDRHQGTRRAFVVSDLSVKRLVNGAEEIGRVPDDINLDFAEAHLKVVRSLEVLEYLGNIHRGRSLQLLFDYMKRGPEEVTSTSGQAIVRAAAGLDPKLPLAERRAAAEVLTQLMEYIQVVHLKHGPLAEDLAQHARKNAIANYHKWKEVADRTGQALKRIYTPEEEVIDDVDPDEIDLDI